MVEYFKIFLIQNIKILPPKNDLFANLFIIESFSSNN